MATQILDTDIMLLQKEGEFDVHDPSYDETKYPNLKYDLKHFHFLGADLRYSVENYIYEEHRYVRVDGDVMYGDLSIVVPKNTSAGVENNPTFTLEGYRNTGTFGSILFKNAASSTGRTMVLNAVSHTDSNLIPYYFQFDQKTRLTEHGELIFHKDDALAKNSISAAGTGYLKHLIDADSLPLLTTDDSYQRVEWNEEGGKLWGGNPERYVVEWSGTGGTIRANSELITWTGDHAEYKGDINLGTDMVNKAYVDGVAGGYIPLVGTRPSNTEVTGTIDFDGGSLNADFGSVLSLTYNDVAHITIGGPFGSTPDGKTHLHSTLILDNAYNTVKLENIPYPDVTPGSTVDDNNAIPKKYVDDGDAVLQHQIDGLTQIAAPPGMINAYVGSTDPEGWYICDGRAVNRNVDPDLYAVVGGNIPNLKGKWLAMPGSSNSATGSSLGVHLSQRTGFPINNSNVAYNNYGERKPYISLGSHNHHIGIENLATYMNNYTNVTAQTAGEHTHKMGRKNAHGNLAGNNREDADGTDFTTSAAGAHTHNVSIQKNNSYSNAYYFPDDLLDNSSYVLREDHFDKHTRPDTYTINWIIKR